MNSYTSIDLATWKRRGTFEYYRTFQNQLFNITLEFPAAELYRYAKRNRISFFLLTLHAILRAVNSVPQFRQRIVDGGQVIEFEHVAALTPIMTPEEEFVMALTEYAPSFAEFRGQAEAAVAAAKRGEYGMLPHDILPEAERLHLRELRTVVRLPIADPGGAHPRPEHRDSHVGKNGRFRQYSVGVAAQSRAGRRTARRQISPRSDRFPDRPRLLVRKIKTAASVADAAVLR